MILENTRLLFRLYYKPVSAMSGIIDEGNWLYGVVSVLVISILLQFAFTRLAYANYDALRQSAQSVTGQARDSVDKDNEEQRSVRPVIVRQPLPILGNLGWWFVPLSPY